MPIDLTKFCAGEDRRGIHRPFDLDGWTYATDGRIMIRMKMDVPCDPPTNKLAANVRAFKFNHDECDLWYRIPETSVHGNVCVRCAGTRMVAECADCGGAGMTECPHCAQEMECIKCWGRGIAPDGGAKRPCRHCPNGFTQGSYRFDEWPAGWVLNTAYCALLATEFDDVEVHFPTIDFNSAPDIALWRSLKGNACGLLMPILKDGE